MIVVVVGLPPMPTATNFVPFQATPLPLPVAPDVLNVFVTGLIHVKPSVE
jgi:hypothetical protein